MKKQLGARDLGITDRHTLVMLQTALVLLAVSMTAMLAFWALSGAG